MIMYNDTTLNISNCFGRKRKLIEIPDFPDSLSNLNIQTVSNPKYITFPGSETRWADRSSTWSVWQCVSNFIITYGDTCLWFTNDFVPVRVCAADTVLSTRQNVGQYLPECSSTPSLSPSHSLSLYVSLLSHHHPLPKIVGSLPNKRLNNERGLHPSVHIAHFPVWVIVCSVLYFPLSCCLYLRIFGTENKYKDILRNILGCCPGLD